MLVQQVLICEENTSNSVKSHHNTLEKPIFSTKRWSRLKVQIHRRHTLYDFSQRSRQTLLQSGHNTQRNARNAIIIPLHFGSNDHRGKRQ